MKALLTGLLIKISLIFTLTVSLCPALFRPYPVEARPLFTSSLSNQDIHRDNDIQKGDLEINYFPQDILIAKDNPSVRITIVVRNRNSLLQIDNVILRLENEKYIPWFSGWPGGAFTLYESQVSNFEVMLTIPEEDKEPEDLHEISISGEYATAGYRAYRTIKVRVMPPASWYQETERSINSLPVEYKQWNPGDTQSLDSVRSNLLSIMRHFREAQDPDNFSKIRGFFNSSLSIARSLNAAEIAINQGSYIGAGQSLRGIEMQLTALQKYLEWERRPEYKGPANFVFATLNRLNDAAQKKFASFVEIKLEEARRIIQEAASEENKAREPRIALFESNAHYQKAMDLYATVAAFFSISQRETDQITAGASIEKARSIKEVTLRDIEMQIAQRRSSADASYNEAVEAKNQAAAASHNLNLSLGFYSEAAELSKKTLEELRRIGDMADSSTIRLITDDLLEIEATMARTVEEVRRERAKAAEKEMQGDRNASSPSGLKVADKLDSFKEAQKYYEEAVDSLARAGSPEDIRKAVIIVSKIEEVKSKEAAQNLQISQQRKVAQNLREEALKAQNSVEIEERLPPKKALLILAIASSNSEIDTYNKISDSPEDLKLIEQARVRIDTLQKEIMDLDQQVEEINSLSMAELKSVARSLKLAGTFPLWPVAKGNFEEAQSRLIAVSFSLNKIGEADKTEDYARYLKMFPQVESRLEIILLSNMVFLIILAIFMLSLLIRFFNLISVGREIDLERSLFQYKAGRTG